MKIQTSSKTYELPDHFEFDLQRDYKEKYQHRVDDQNVEIMNEFYTVVNSNEDKDRIMEGND